MATAVAAFAASSSSAPSTRLVHEHHVGVGAVAGLVAAEPAHQHDRHPGRQLAALRLDRGRGRDQRARQRGRGDVGQCRAHLDDVEPAQHVGDADARELATPHPPHGPDGVVGLAVTARGELHLRVQPVGVARHQLGIVTEQSDRVGGAQDQVGDITAGSDDLGELLGPFPLVAELAQVPVRLARPSEILRNASRPASGSGDCANHSSMAGSSERWMDARRETPEVRALMCASAPRGSTKPSAVSRCSAASGVSRRPSVGDGRHRLQQRLVEELLVQAPNHPLLRVPLLLQALGRVVAVPHAPADAAQVLLVVGHHVRPAQAVQLDAVLQRPQELVGLLHRGSVAPADVAAVDQGLQRPQRGGAAQRVVAAAVHELQQLHRELDVAQTAGAELELAVPVLRRDVLDARGGASPERPARSSRAC